MLSWKTQMGFSTYRSEKHLLASCLTKLLTEDILPNATKVKGAETRV